MHIEELRCLGSFIHCWKFKHGFCTTGAVEQTYGQRWSSCKYLEEKSGLRHEY